MKMEINVESEGEIKEAIEKIMSGILEGIGKERPVVIKNISIKVATANGGGATVNMK